LVVEKIRAGDLTVKTAVLPGSRDGDEAAGVGIGQGTQENSVDNAENRGIRADAEREDGNRERRKSGVAAERAKSEFQVQSMPLCR
jgi:hypothetical protein